MGKNPSLHRVQDVIDNSTEVEIESKWYPARGIGLYSIFNRFRYAWMVFTGKADALIWHKQ